MTVLHFFTLPELADDLEYGTVRVESLVQTVPSKTPGLATRIAQVHARAIVPVPEGMHTADPRIMAFMLQVGQVQTLHGQPANEEAAQLLDDELGRTTEAVKAYLRERGFEVRPGLIDLGGAEPVRGTREGLEFTHPHPSLPSPSGRGDGGEGGNDGG